MDLEVCLLHTPLEWTSLFPLLLRALLADGRYCLWQNIESKGVIYLDIIACHVCNVCYADAIQLPLAGESLFSKPYHFLGSLHLMKYGYKDLAPMANLGVTNKVQP